jgi:hypothetical protein
MKKLTILVMILGSSLVNAAIADDQSMAESFPGPWLEPNPAVLRTLFRRSVHDCGFVRIHAEKSDPGTFLVYCTMGLHEAWHAYVVVPEVDGISPRPVPKSIPLPTIK